MSFEKPERMLTKEEWKILTDAAVEGAFTYRRNSAYCHKDGDMSGVKHWNKKSDKIFDVLIKLENEYYKAHPDEDPDRKEE